MNRPLVKVNMAMTLDGKVMRPDGRWYGLSSPADRHRMDLYRQEADMLLVGKESVIQDDPVVVPKHMPDGILPPQPVMICRNSLPPVDRKIFRQNTVRPLLCITAELEAGIGELADCADLEIFAAPPDPVSVLDRLFQRGSRGVLLEGGPRVNWAFFEADVVDVLYLTLVPFLIGQKDLPAIVDGPTAFSGFADRAWDLHQALTIGREIFLEYRRIRGDPSR